MAARRRAERRAQRGMALIGLLTVAVVAFAYVLTSRLNAASQFVGVDRDENAKVLAQAKRALIGWMAMNAAGTDDNPGRLPCPEAPGDFGTVNEGRAASSCLPPNNVGRLPWRTLGMPKLADANGEPLWYAVSPGWSLPGAATTPINSDSAGQLTLDGAPNSAVALILAPGATLQVQAGGGCTAWSQARPVTGPPDVRNYLECGNAVANYVTASPGSTFNDQVLRISTEDLQPALQSAIGERLQRDIASAVRSAAFELDTNTPRRWVATASLPASSSPLPHSSTPLMYPYPVPFTTPTTPLSNFRGVVGTNQGLMPFAPVAGFVAFQATPPNVVKTSSAGSISLISCYWESAAVYACEGRYTEDSVNPSLPITVEMTATFANAAMGFRARNTAALTAEARDNGTPTWSTANVSTNKRLEINDGGTSGKPRGSATARLTATLPVIDDMGWGSYAEFRLRMDIAVVADHPLLSPTARMLRFVGGSSAISSGNTVTGATSGASGAVQVVVDSGTWSGGNAAGALFFTSVSGTFQSGEALQVSGSTRATSSGVDRDIGWFARNEWYRNTYYAVAPAHTADWLPGLGCSTDPSASPSSSRCLRFNSSSTYNVRALLVLGGGALPTRPARPNSDPRAYFEDQNADNGTLYEQRLARMSRVAISPGSPPPATFIAPWNDSVVVVEWHPSGLPAPSVNGPQLISAAPLRLYTIP